MPPDRVERAAATLDRVSGVSSLLRTQLTRRPQASRLHLHPHVERSVRWQVGEKPQRTGLGAGPESGEPGRGERGPHHGAPLPVGGALKADHPVLVEVAQARVRAPEPEGVLIAADLAQQCRVVDLEGCRRSCPGRDDRARPVEARREVGRVQPEPQGAGVGESSHAGRHERLSWAGCSVHTHQLRCPVHVRRPPRLRPPVRVGNDQLRGRSRVCRSWRRTSRSPPRAARRARRDQGHHQGRRREAVRPIRPTTGSRCSTPITMPSVSQECCAAARTPPTSPGRAR